MPIYDYRCDHCGHAFSALQSFKDEAIATCPGCGKQPRRLLVPPAIVFKGSGWYKTDSRTPPKDGGGAKAADGDKGGAAKTADGDKGGAAKTAGKPAEKPAADTSKPKKSEAAS